MTIHSACKNSHTLVPLVADIWACECPAVFRKQGRGWLDPARAGLLDDILLMTGGVTGLHSLAYAAEKKEQAKRETKKVAA